MYLKQFPICIYRKFQNVLLKEASVMKTRADLCVELMVKHILLDVILSGHNVVGIKSVLSIVGRVKVIFFLFMALH